MKKLVALFFLLAVANIAWAQDDDDDEVVEAIDYAALDSMVISEYGEDSTLISPPYFVDPKVTKAVSDYEKEDQPVKEFDRDKWKEIVGDETFEENKIDFEPPAVREGWNFPGLGMSAELLRLIGYVAVFALFAFILYYVANKVTFKEKVRSIKPIDVSKAVENIEEVDLEGLLRQAMNDTDLRLAVRVYYLLLLRRLNEAGLIAWKKDKTNRDYLSELYGRESVYEDVRKLTLAYELVWYGERSVSQDSFQRIRGDFESVDKNVVNVKASE